MTEGEKKGERNRRSVVQEEDNVATERKRGNPSYRVAREIDVVTFSKKGIVYLTDCKHTEKDTMYVEARDIAKGIREVRKLQHCGMSAVFRVDVWFCRCKRNHRKYIEIGEDYLGYGLKCTKTAKTIRVEKVQRGRLSRRVAKEVLNGRS